MISDWAQSPRTCDEVRQIPELAWALTHWPHFGAHGSLCLLLPIGRHLSRRNACKCVPSGCKIVECEPGRFRVDRCSNTGAFELGKKFARIGERCRADTRHRRFWSKAAGDLLEEDYVSLFGAAPDSSNEPSTGPKYAFNLTGRGGAINHIHQAEGGQCNVKLAGGCGYLLGTSLQKGDIAQAQPGRPLPRKPSISGLMSTAVTFPPGVTKEAP